jgi:hypothetical protein
MAPATTWAKERRREIRRLRRKVGWQEIPVTYDRKDLTSGGHVPLFVDFCRVMGLEGSIARRVRLDRLPTAQALRDFMEGFTEANVKELLAVNRDVLSAATSGGREPLTVSFLSDDTVITVYGRQEGAEVGYNPRKKGRRSYLARLCVIDELDAVTHAELDSGGERPLTRQAEFFDEAFRTLPEGVRVARVRLDRGHFSEETCRYFEGRRPATYYLKVKVNARMVSDWHGLPDEVFDPIPGDDREIARVRYRPVTWEKEREFAVLRRRAPVKDEAQARLLDAPAYEFEAVVTNDEESPAIEVWRSCNDGADVENRIRELKYEFFIDRIGSGKFAANAAHFVWKAIVHNLVISSDN